MLIPFSKLFKQYDVKARGVLHIGAHTGQEMEAYLDCGIRNIIWIEANPDLILRLARHTDKILKDKSLRYECHNHIYTLCIGDVDGEEKIFKVSSNDGQSSSYLELGTHKVVHPDVTMVSEFKTTTTRIDTFFEQHQGDIQLYDYNFLNIDLQGAELFALKGMGDILKVFDYAYLEVNKAELYVSCALINEIDDYMLKFGFVRKEVLWAGNTNWGDAFYVKELLFA